MHKFLTISHLNEITYLFAVINIKNRIIEYYLQNHLKIMKIKPFEVTNI